MEPGALCARSNISGQALAPGTAMTRKDSAMDWTQIETKWAAMTLRVRADWTADRADGNTPLARRVARGAVPAAVIPARQAGAGVDAKRKLSAE